jgi:hypothetical protein
MIGMRLTVSDLSFEPPWRRLEPFAALHEFPLAAGGRLPRRHQSPKRRDGATKLTTVYRGGSRHFFKLAKPVIVRLTKKHFETATERV